MIKFFSRLKALRCFSYNSWDSSKKLPSLLHKAFHRLVRHCTSPALATPSSSIFPSFYAFDTLCRKSLVSPSSFLFGYNGYPVTHFYRTMARLSSRLDEVHCFSHLRSHVVSLFLLPLVSTHLFFRIGGVRSYQYSSIHSSPQYPLRNLSFLIMLAVFCLVSAKMCSQLSRFGRIEIPSCSVCVHPTSGHFSFHSVLSSYRFFAQFCFSATSFLSTFSGQGKGNRPALWLLSAMWLHELHHRPQSMLTIAQH